MRQIPHAGAAVFLLDRDAVQPERAHLGPQLDRETVGAVDLGGNRRDPVLGEIAHRRAQQVDLGAEIMVEHREAGVLHTLYMIRDCAPVRITRYGTARHRSRYG